MDQIELWSGWTPPQFLAIVISRSAIDERNSCACGIEDLLDMCPAVFKERKML
ncbi:hypothetical protein PILCRDRAFT_811647 [Piloderma croceum F 1598]|uniref:Uncharacterized protein n=1 Tax=Piloderma croceum (strain F 1598) TaxID=765440 RepID=A0A0C3GHM2_PILCF|nr:hypothetical protein PILCRDRAFT_811647 [Piloderma croceum F 1598]